MSPARDGAQDVEIGDQGLGCRGIGSHGGARPVVRHLQHEQRVREDEGPRRVGPGDVDLIELADLARGEPMRHDRLDEADAVIRVGARQRDEVFHRRVRDELAVLNAVLDGVGQGAHQAEASRDPAYAAIEAARQRVERQPVVLMQRAQEPALFERTVGRVSVEKLPKDQRLGLRHLPEDRRDGVALQPAQTADPFVPVHDDVGRARRHDHDRHLLTGVRQRRQEAPFPRRLPHAQPLIPHIELMKFQLHVCSDGAYCGRAPIGSCTEAGGSRPRSPRDPVT
jgi:hypothetical protein